ncbi:MAG: MBL fold metallo-hydrolase [Bacteriovoracia bacterium]
MASTTITILGCGTSTGVPLLHCPCKVCTSKDPRNQRLRASAWVQSGGKSILIDTATDLRQQALREKIPRVDAVLYTHPHSDHVSGVDELRSFNFLQKSSIPIYGNDWTIRELTHRYQYIFEDRPLKGGGKPSLIPHLVAADAAELDIQGLKVIPIPLRHGGEPCFGYRIGSVAYLTDLNEIPEKSYDRLRGLSILILDCLRIGAHDTHLSLDRALEIASRIAAEKTVLTHLGHDFDFGEWEKKLPNNITLAYDGLKLEVTS